jgi:CRISPR-associated protein Csm3
MTEDIYIHRCETKEDYEKCEVCQIFGIAPVQEKKADIGESPATREKKSPEEFGKPTRIIVRDAMMTACSAKKLEKAATDLPFTEVKWEAVIDRVTSKAMPRQIERVPAGVEFDFSLCYNIFEKNDIQMFKSVLIALELLEQDYLGGQGTRGYGQIQFNDLKLFWNSAKDYELCTLYLENSEDEKTKEPIYKTKNIEKMIEEFEKAMKKITLESE